MSNIRPSNLPIEETDLIGFVHTDRGVAGSAKFNLANVSSALNLDGMATQAPSAVAITGGTINGTTIGGTTAAAGTFTNLTGSTKVATPFVDATTSAGGQLRNASGTSQLAWGAGGGNNLTLEVATNINPANGSVSIAPTGTGTVTINPATAGTVNNMAIGGTTAAAGAFTTLAASGVITNTLAGGSLSFNSVSGNTAGTYNQFTTSAGAKIYYGIGSQIVGGTTVNDFVLDSISGNVIISTAETARATISSTGLNATAIGATTPSTGAFTTVSSTTGANFIGPAGNGVPALTVRPDNNVGINWVVERAGDTSGTAAMGTSTNHNVSIITNNTEKMRIDSSGNVGIGTASPADRLHVGGSSPIIRVEPSTATQGATTRYINTGGTFFSGIDSSAGGFGVAYSGVMWHGGAYPLLFGTSNTERLRIDSSGNVGIGTADQFGGGAGVVGIANASTVPASNPTGGGVLYVEAGALKYRGSSGTVTTIANA